MIIQWYTILFVFVFVECQAANSIDHLCNYTIKKADGDFDACLSNQCNRFLDPYLIMLKQNDCKTNLLYLTFSSYKNLSSFMNRTTWQLGHLFPARQRKETRLLRIYINKIDDDDQPVYHNELTRIGSHIDLYELYIGFIPKDHYLHDLSHYDPNDSQWYIIKIKFVCYWWMFYNDKQCSSYILSPLNSAPRRPLVPTSAIVSSIQVVANSSTDKQRFTIHLLLIIIIPLLLLLLVVALSICTYRKYFAERCFKIDLRSTPTPTSTSIPSLTNNVEIRSSSIIPENVITTEQTPSHTTSHDYHHHTQNHSTRNQNDVYERISLGNQSPFGQQYFSPISSAFRF